MLITGISMRTTQLTRYEEENTIGHYNLYDLLVFFVVKLVSTNSTKFTRHKTNYNLRNNLFESTEITKDVV